MSVVVIIAGLATGARTAWDGQYVRGWDPHTKEGTLKLWPTKELKRAKKFKDIAEVFAEWKTVSDRQPVRHDGKPNRPLTAMNISIEGDHDQNA